MQHLEVSCAVRPIWWPLGVKWLSSANISVVIESCTVNFTPSNRLERPKGGVEV